MSSGRTSRRRRNREQFQAEQAERSEQEYEVRYGQKKPHEVSYVVARVICRQHATTLATVTRSLGRHGSFLAVRSPIPTVVKIDSGLTEPIALRCPKCTTDKPVYPSQLRAAMTADRKTIGAIRIRL